MPGTLFVVATPIGNLEDVTARALRILGEVSLIAAEDTRRTARLLSHYAIRTPTTSLHAHNEASATPRLIARLVAGASVALVSDAGTPTLSDPGTRLVQAAYEAGVLVEPVPGPSALTCLLSIAGLPAWSFLFLGFPPTKPALRDAWMAKATQADLPVAFFEAPHRVRSTLSELAERCGDRRVVIGREMTKLHEEIVRGSLSDVLKSHFREQGEFAILLDIGQSMEYRPSPVGDEPPVGLDELGHLADRNPSINRKKAVQIAQILGLNPNDVYDVFTHRQK